MTYALVLLLLLQQKNVVFFHFDSNYFSALGKWASTSADPKDQISMPQEVQIDCFRAERRCVEATAEYYLGHPHIAVSYFEIIQWSKDGITAVSTAVCMTNKLLINSSDKSITAIDSPRALPEPQKKACAAFGGGESPPPLVFVLRGSERWEKEHWQVK